MQIQKKVPPQYKQGLVQEALIWLSLVTFGESGRLYCGGTVFLEDLYQVQYLLKKMLAKLASISRLDQIKEDSLIWPNLGTLLNLF